LGVGPFAVGSWAFRSWELGLWELGVGELGVGSLGVGSWELGVERPPWHVARCPCIILPMRRLVVVVAIACVSWACGGSPNDGQSPPPGSGDTIRGNERLGWDQQAASPAELAQLRYAIYIDGVRSTLADAQCTPNAASAGYPCSARLPTMSAGTHTLELAAFRLEGGVVSESSRSPALVITVSSSASALNAASVPSAQPAPSPDAKNAPTLALSPVADGFSEITDLSLVKSRLLMVAERRGMLHAIDLEREVRFESLVFEGTAAAGESGELWSIAVDPAFDTTGLVYALQTGPARSGETVWQLVRYRRVASRFGERAVLAELPHDARAGVPGVLRLAPDGTLHVAVTSGRRTIADPSGRSVLVRLNTDGTTPRDQPGGNPERGAFSGLARGIGWDGDAGIEWALHDSGPDGVRLVAIGADQRMARAGLHDQDFSLARVSAAKSLAFYNAERFTDLQRTILIAGANGLDGLRVDRNGRPEREPRRLVDGPLSAVHVTAAGELVLGTASGVFLARID
jgi:glucose/arabinose dehydrogenase